MADAAGAKETLKEMTHMGATSEGRHLLAAQAHALVLSSKDNLKVRCFRVTFSMKPLLQADVPTLCGIRCETELLVMWGSTSQELVHHLLDSTAAKSIIVSIPHYLSLENLKEVIEHVKHFLANKLEDYKKMLGPLIAKAVEHSGANSEKLKGLLAQLTTFAHHSKVPFDTKCHISHTPAQCHRPM
jgi:hypothetical protein